jgi:hypothetical protein
MANADDGAVDVDSDGDTESQSGDWTPSMAGAPSPSLISASASVPPNSTALEHEHEHYAEHHEYEYEDEDEKFDLDRPSPVRSLGSMANRPAPGRSVLRRRNSRGNIIPSAHLTPNRNLPSRHRHLVFAPGTAWAPSEASTKRIDEEVQLGLKLRARTRRFMQIAAARFGPEWQEGRREGEGLVQQLLRESQENEEREERERERLERAAQSNDALASSSALVFAPIPAPVPAPAPASGPQADEASISSTTSSSASSQVQAPVSITGTTATSSRSRSRWGLDSAYHSAYNVGNQSHRAPAPAPVPAPVPASTLRTRGASSTSPTSATGSSMPAAAPVPAAVSVSAWAPAPAASLQAFGPRLQAVYDQRDLLALGINTDAVTSSRRIPSRARAPLDRQYAHLDVTHPQPQRRYNAGAWRHQDRSMVNPTKHRPLKRMYAALDIDDADAIQEQQQNEEALRYAARRRMDADAAAAFTAGTRLTVDEHVSRARLRESLVRGRRGNLEYNARLQAQADRHNPRPVIRHTSIEDLLNGVPPVVAPSPRPDPGGLSRSLGLSLRSFPGFPAPVPAHVSYVPRTKAERDAADIERPDLEMKKRMRKERERERAQIEEDVRRNIAQQAEEAARMMDDEAKRKRQEEEEREEEEDRERAAAWAEEQQVLHSMSLPADRSPKRRGEQSSSLPPSSPPTPSSSSPARHRPRAPVAKDEDVLEDTAEQITLRVLASDPDNDPIAQATAWASIIAQGAQPASISAGGNWSQGSAFAGPSMSAVQRRQKSQQQEQEDEEDDENLEVPILTSGNTPSPPPRVVTPELVLDEDENPFLVPKAQAQAQVGAEPDVSDWDQVQVIGQARALASAHGTRVPFAVLAEHDPTPDMSLSHYPESSDEDNVAAQVIDTANVDDDTALPRSPSTGPFMTSDHSPTRISRSRHSSRASVALRQQTANSSSPNNATAAASAGGPERTLTRRTNGTMALRDRTPYGRVRRRGSAGTLAHTPAPAAAPTSPPVPVVATVVAVATVTNTTATVPVGPQTRRRTRSTQSNADAATTTPAPAPVAIVAPVAPAQRRARARRQSQTQQQVQTQAQSQQQAQSLAQTQPQMLAEAEARERPLRRKGSDGEVKA